MSTTLLIDLCPIFSNRFLSQSGDSLTLMLFIIMAVNRGLIFESVFIVSGKGFWAFGMLDNLGNLTCFFSIAAISLAIPIIDKQSGRFGVISNSKIVSS